MEEQDKMYAELKNAIARGIISLSDTEEMIAMIERKEYLEKHQYRIYEGKDGQWHTYLPDPAKKTKRRHIKRRTKAEVEDVVASFYKEGVDDPTIEDVFNEWQEYRLAIGKVKPATITRYQQDFDRYFYIFKRSKIRSISEMEIEKFLGGEIRKNLLNARAYSNLKTILRGILKYAKRKKLIFFEVESLLAEMDVSDRELKRTTVDDEKEIFYDDEYERVLQYCYEHRDDICCLGVALMFVTGLRVGEVVSLTRSDILDGAIYVHRNETKYRKDGHIVYEVEERPKTPAGIRHVIVPDMYGWVLDGLRKVPNGFIFTGKSGRLHTQAIRKRQYQICRKLGIPVRSPHKARKTYGSILLDGHADTKLIERQMGHTDISCTEAHYHRDRKTVDQKRAIINAIFEH